MKQSSCKVWLKSSHIFRGFANFVLYGPFLNFLNKSFLQFLWQSRWDRDIHGYREDVGLEKTKQHIDSAIKFLLKKQEGQSDNGIPATVYFRLGQEFIDGSYPEVNGYIIPTLLDYSKKFSSKKSFHAAIKLADFVSTQQDKYHGYFLGGSVGAYTGPSVFNTAQIVHGLVRVYRETDNENYLRVLEKASDWIVSVQQSDGSWSEHNYRGLGRVYDSKVAQALWEAHVVTGNPEYCNSAKRNLDFVVKNQLKNGWFKNCDNTTYRNFEPLTHLIGYTVQGLIECYKMSKEKKYYFSAKKTLHKLLHWFEVNKRPINGRFNSKWQPTVKSCCVTGLAQISICWLEIFKLTDDYRYLNAALKANDVLKGLQIVSKDKSINGSLPASSPAWGDYGTYKINTWGVKYALDAWILEYKIKEKILEGI